MTVIIIVMVSIVLETNESVGNIDGGNNSLKALS